MTRSKSTKNTVRDAAPIDGPEAVAPGGEHRVGPVVAASLAVGLVAAAALAVVAFAGAEEHVITGTVLLAFALGWALLAACSVLWTDQPQRWAAVPAGFMGLVGAGLLIFAPGAAGLQDLGWVWPPALLTLVVWMVIQARRQLRRRTRRWLLYPVFGFLALASLGGVYETVGESLDRGALPARVCSYDPAGRGWSESATGSPSSTQAVTDLRTLLSRAGEPGPYVLVGHSLGGTYVLGFAQQFPAQVAGMALVDSMTPYQFTKLPGYASFYDGLRRVSGLLPSVARLGVGRIVGSEYGAREVRGFRDEVAGIPDALNRAQTLKGIGDTPLIVVTAGKGQQAGWAAAQADLTRLSTNCLHRLVPGATHTSLLDDRADAAVSSRAISDVVRSARAANPPPKS